MNRSYQERMCEYTIKSTGKRFYMAEDDDTPGAQAAIAAAEVKQARKAARRRALLKN